MKCSVQGLHVMTLIISDLGGYFSGDGMRCLRAYKIYCWRTL